MIQNLTASELERLAYITDDKQLYKALQGKVSAFDDVISLQVQTLQKENATLKTLARELDEENAELVATIRGLEEQIASLCYPQLICGMGMVQ